MPAGNVELPVARVTLKVSVPLPVLVTVLVKLTVEPGAAGPGSVWPLRVTLATCFTWNGTVLELPGTVVPAPLL